MRLFKQKPAKKRSRQRSSSVAATIQRSPSLAGGATALVVVMGLVTVNAVWFQTGKHPAPIFSTNVQNGPGSQFVKTTPARKPGSKILVDAELAREVQAALVVKGIYSGDIDGVVGSKTRAAVVTYQEEVGLPVDGKISAKLLSHILLSKKALEHVPVPKSQIALHEPKHDSKAETTKKSLVSTIQTGLRNYGYDDIVVDGVMGNQTSTAIRRFELDYGLEVTGKATNAVLKKLNDIGVINQG